MDIVKEIIAAIKPIIELETGFSQLDYEYETEKNSERSLAQRYGFTAGSADFVDGRAMGRTTLNHSFTLNLIDDYQNKDDDAALRTKIALLYSKHHGLLVKLQKSRLALPTPDNRVNLISGLSFDEPEVLSENSSVSLKQNINIQYSYKNS